MNARDKTVFARGDEELLVRMRAVGATVQPPAFFDSTVLARRAVRRVRIRRVLLAVTGGVTVIGLVGGGIAVAGLLPADPALVPPGLDPSPVASVSPSGSPSVSPSASASPSPTPDISGTSSGDLDGWVYEAVNVPEGWSSVGVTGLAFALPSTWETLGEKLPGEWQYWGWVDAVAQRAATDAAAGEVVRVPMLNVVVGTDPTSGTTSDEVLEETDLTVAGADTAHLRLTRPSDGGLRMSLSVHQAGGLWYDFNAALPEGDAGLGMAHDIAGSLVFAATAEEILATLPRVDHLLVLEVTRGVPAGWTGRETHGLGYALGMDWVADTRGYVPNNPATSLWMVPDAIAPGLAASLAVTWSEQDYLLPYDPDPATRRLELDGAGLATVLWEETEWDTEGASPAGPTVMMGQAIVERADGGGHYTISFTLPVGSQELLQQFLGTLTVS